MSAEKKGRTIFIGNIPYGLTEEQIIHIFSAVGTVLNFRLVFDKDTGRPKGFGFAEFADADQAAAAVRNLNDHEIMNRRLRVDYSNEGSAGNGGVDGNRDGGDSNQQQASIPQQPPPPAAGLPPLPPGTDLPPGLTCPDAISRTLHALPPPQLLEMLSQMKNLVATDPAKATELLRNAPQMSYAIFQALLLLGLVDTSVLASVVEQAASNPQAPAPPPPQPMPIPPPQQHIPPPHHLAGPPQMPMYPPQPGQPGAPPIPQYPPQHLAHLQPGMQHVPTPPPQFQHPHQHPGPMHPPMPPPQQHQQPPPQQFQAPPNQAAAFQQIMAMSQQQIDAMEQGARAQIMQIRQQLMAAGYR